MAFDFTILPLAPPLSRIASSLWPRAARATGLWVALGAEVVAVLARLEEGDAGCREPWYARPRKSPTCAGADGASAGWWGIASLCNLPHPYDHDLRVKRHTFGLLNEQAFQLRFRFREVISCFCCVQTCHTALKADSRSRSRRCTGNELSPKIWVYRPVYRSDDSCPVVWFLLTTEKRRESRVDWTFAISKVFL